MKLLLNFFVLLLAIALNHSKDLPVLEDDPQIGSEKGALHVVTTTECGSNYFTFQSLALRYTFDRVYQPGKLTRIISCDQIETISHEDLDIMKTLVVPNWTKHPRSGDVYSPYNRPVGLMFWLAKEKPKAEWTLIVDPDMQFRQPILPEDFNIPEGFAMSSGYSYLKGVSNELAERHIPDIPPRDDTYGGEKGRRADMSGSFFLMRTRDLMRVAPLWLKFTEDVRNDPQAWNNTGDSYVKPGGKPWISEMYGYVFAAATAGIWHKIDATVQYYPSYHPRDIPLLMHYGLRTSVENFSFDKHEHFTFDALSCPPWNLSPGRNEIEDRGLFPHPPFPDVVTTEEPRERYGKLMVIEAVNVLNQALCLRHLVKCPASPQLTEECSKVNDIANALEVAFQKIHKENALCHDDDSRCAVWADSGECSHSWKYMDILCRASCQKCRHYAAIHHSEEATMHINATAEMEMQVNVTDMDDAFELDGDSADVEKEKKRCLKLKADLMNDVRCKGLAARGFLRVNNFQMLSIASGDKDAHTQRTSLLGWSLLGVCVVFMLFVSLKSLKSKRRPDLKHR